MNVLSIVPDFIEKPSGGLGEQYRNFHKCLSDRVNFYTVGYPEKNSIKNYSYATNPIPMFNHVSLITIFGQSMYFLKALEYKKDFDLIHAFDWSSFYAGVLASWHFKKPLITSVNLSLRLLNESGIYYCQDMESQDGASINNLQVCFEDMGLFYSNKIIHVSEYYRDQFPDYKDKSIIINNGLDIDAWKQKRTPKLPGKNKLKFCYIGRASVMKGLQTILNCNIPDDIDFYFVVSKKNAEQPIYQYIKQKANNKNIFHIPGLYGQDKIDFLFSMDGVVMPSIHEPFGIVALEALMSENLFITTASGGIKEIVKDIDYFYITDEKDLENTFNRIKKLTPEQRESIIKKGKECAMTYSWANQSEKLYNLYKETVNLPYISNKFN